MLLKWGWTIVLVAACGLADVDSGSYLSTLANAGPIRVTVYKFGGDSTGAPVVEPDIRVDFIAPDQTAQTLVTDAGGVAEATAPPGTRVVVYQWGEGGTPFFRSYDSVNPGDSIIVDRHPRQAFPPLGDITFAL